MLGIYLGHQAIAEVFASRIAYAKEILHGKCDAITQTAACALFDGLPVTFPAARYHSLVVEQPGRELIVTALSIRYSVSSGIHSDTGWYAYH